MNLKNRSKPKWYVALPTKILTQESLMLASFQLPN